MKHRTYVLVLAAAMLLAGDLAAVRESCAQAKTCDTNCCMLPCLEYERAIGRYRLDRYRALAKKPRLTAADIDAMENDARRHEASVQTTLYQGSPQCRYLVPDPKDRNAYTQVREFQAAGFTYEEGSGWDIDVKTDAVACTLNQRRLQALRGVVPCTQLWDRMLHHEEKHVAQCKARGRAPTPQDLVKGEIDAYDAELKELDGVYQATLGWCEKTVCKTQDAKKAADRIVDAARLLKAGS
ncbi:MAG TPA: hypothetical protein VGL09_10570 [Methylomirabilota bacterium]|jgi:hypothetical protein